MISIQFGHGVGYLQGRDPEGQAQEPLMTSRRSWATGELSETSGPGQSCASKWMAGGHFVKNGWSHRSKSTSEEPLRSKNIKYAWSCGPGNAFVLFENFKVLFNLFDWNTQYFQRFKSYGSFITFSVIMLDSPRLLLLLSTWGYLSIPISHSHPQSQSLDNDSIYVYDTNMQIG